MKRLPVPAAGVFDALSQDCRCMDTNGDQALDQQDFGAFQACFSGTDPVDPNCDD